MRIAIVGTGYVGLVTGVCLAETGNTVVCMDKDASKIDMLNSGKLPIYELGLDELYEHNRQAGRLTFTRDLAEAMHSSDIIFIAVGTPPEPDGSADLSAIWGVADGIANAMDHHCLVVVKSTVPVGTTLAVKQRIAARTDQSFNIANNPEFLKEGLAIDDFNKPDRIVVGVENDHAGNLLSELYLPFLRSGNPMIVTDIQTSELTKYAANGMLATKVSFINEIANLCELVGGDIDQLRRGVCSDKRIGFQFMFPGIGYGGSCFPKDVPALIHLARQHGMETRILQAVHEVNQLQPLRMIEKIKDYFQGELAGRTIAVWGAAYKAGTNDVRFSPSITIIESLLDSGAHVRLHDPQALPAARDVLGNRVTYCDKCYAAVEGADVLLVATDWREYRSPEFDRIRATLSDPAIFDGRNIFLPQRLRDRGFKYYGVGRLGG